MDGSSAFVGRIVDSVTLGAGESTQTTLTNGQGGEDGFVARLAADGHLLWASQIAGDQALDVYVVSSLPDGSVWVAGDYAAGLGPSVTSTLDFAAGTPSVMSVKTSGEFSFVARFGADGKPAWVVPFSSAGYLRTLAVSATPHERNRCTKPMFHVAWG
jgi:hypothetical protein